MSTSVTDEQVQQLAATGRPFSIAQLRWTNDRHMEGSEAIEAEHQRRMVSMRADGVIAILLPVLSDDVAGVAVMTPPLEEAEQIMRDDPCVRAGMMTVEVLPCLGFPGDSLPG